MFSSGPMLPPSLTPTHLISFDFVWWCFIFQWRERPFIVPIASHLDGIAELASPTWWIISCIARCKTIWWTLLPPAEPKRLIILQPFTRGSSSEAAVTQKGWMLPSVLSFLFLSVSEYMSWAQSGTSMACGVEFCFRNQGTTSSWLSTSLVTLSGTPGRSQRALRVLPSLFTLRTQRAPAGWVSPVYGVLRNPWGNSSPRFFTWSVERQLGKQAFSRTGRWVPLRVLASGLPTSVTHSGFCPGSPQVSQCLFLVTVFFFALENWTHFRSREKRHPNSIRNFWGLFICCFSWLWGQFHRYICMSQLIKVDALNMYSLLYVSYTSIKLLKNKNKTYTQHFWCQGSTVLPCTITRKLGLKFKKNLHKEMMLAPAELS